MEQLLQSRQQTSAIPLAQAVLYGFVGHQWKTFRVISAEASPKLRVVDDARVRPYNKGDYSANKTEATPAWGEAKGKEPHSDATLV